MFKKLIEIFKDRYRKYKNRYGIDSSFFEIGKKYKVKETFNSEEYQFIHDEILICNGNYLAWYDGVFVITFQSVKNEQKVIFIKECYLDNGRHWPRPDTDLEVELHSYEKYFERLT